MHLVGFLKFNLVHSQSSMDLQGEGEFVEKSDAEKRRLWVEQYSPRSYLELLSEEFINRALLRWIKVREFIVVTEE